MKKLKKRNKKRLFLEFLYSLLLGGREYDTEIAKTSPLPLRTILATLIMTALVLASVFSFIEISALSSDIGNLKKEYVTLTSKEGKLRDDLNHKYPHAELMEEIEAMGFSENGGQTIILESADMEKDK